MKHDSNVDRITVDSLKGIGILGVVLVHCGINTSNELVSSIVANGARGVQLLFIINAFLIFISLSKIKLDRKNIILWYKNKFLRIIPLYWFFTFLHLAVFGLGERYYLGPLPKVSWLNILCNLFFLQGFYPYYNSINANWFMGVLAIFYLIAPFLYKIIDSLEKSILAVLLVTPCGYILMHFAIGLNVLEVKGIWNDYVNIISFPAEFPVILLGILTYYIYKEIIGKDVLKNKVIFSAVLTFFSAFCMLSVLLRKNYFTIFNNIFSFGVLLMLIVIAQLIYPTKIIKNQVFAFCGRHSYGIYLSHIIVMKYVKNIVGLFGNNIIFDIVAYVATVSISIAVSLIAEKLIEENIKGLFGKIKK
jgi:peptidoglycan/LPS O-acetylase OafA/YrhL